MGRPGETGKRTIELYADEGMACEIAPDNRVLTGIERVKALLTSVDAEKTPMLRVFANCVEIQRERKFYSWQEVGADESKEKPVKVDDHLLDCLRYLAAAQLKYVQHRSEPPPPGSIARLFWDQRHAVNQKERL